MIKKRIINNDEPVYDIVHYEEHGDVSFILDKISKQFKTVIGEVNEGPGTTIINLLIEDRPFLLVNNNWGNYIKPENENSENLIESNKMIFDAMFDK